MLSFQELQYLFASADQLPHLPESPLELAKLLEKSDPNPAEIEKHILADPALMAGIFRAASSAVYGRGKAPTTTREAVNLLGHRSLRAIAVALWTNSLTRAKVRTPHFQINRFILNANTVGNFASTIATRKKLQGDWSPDELLAAGTLHNVLYALLAIAAPEEFTAVYEFAERGQITLDQAFLMVFQNPIQSLAPRACETLCLPKMFVYAATIMEQETEDPTHFALQDAIHIANEFGCGLQTWSTPITILKCGLSEEEIQDILTINAERPGLLAVA